jgi:hypothetical protein
MSKTAKFGKKTQGILGVKILHFQNSTRFLGFTGSQYTNCQFSPNIDAKELEEN